MVKFHWKKIITKSYTNTSMIIPPLVQRKCKEKKEKNTQEKGSIPKCLSCPVIPAESGSIAASQHKMENREQPSCTELMKY